mmetsp:Transcript_49285/g.112192  ORF Transcript_49285/g.112192 Transcript_49285/m.112192 type:complete len:217 (-) Transcript_49285:930-1580(-)
MPDFRSDMAMQLTPGLPYSRAQSEPCCKAPPTCRITAAQPMKSGVQDGSVTTVAKMSPFSSFSRELVRILTVPVATPGEIAVPTSVPGSCALTLGLSMRHRESTRKGHVVARFARRYCAFLGATTARRFTDGSPRAWSTSAIVRWKTSPASSRRPDFSNWASQEHTPVRTALKISAWESFGAFRIHMIWSRARLRSRTLRLWVEDSAARSCLSCAS